MACYEDSFTHFTSLNIYTPSLILVFLVWYFLYPAALNKTRISAVTSFASCLCCSPHYITAIAAGHPCPCPCLVGQRTPYCAAHCSTFAISK
jgi:hypothetical protein